MSLIRCDYYRILVCLGSIQHCNLYNAVAKSMTQQLSVEACHAISILLRNVSVIYRVQKMLPLGPIASHLNVRLLLSFVLGSLDLFSIGINLELWIL